MPWQLGDMDMPLVERMLVGVSNGSLDWSPSELAPQDGSLLLFVCLPQGDEPGVLWSAYWVEMMSEMEPPMDASHYMAVPKSFRN